MRKMKEIKARGIDVSSHQGVIDWDKVKACGVEFAILRCGYGSDIPSQDDVQFSRNASECARTGIPYGVYLYSYALNAEMAQSEAKHVLRLVKENPALPIFLDLEDAATTGKQSNETILEIARTFCEEIEKAGLTAGIYANLNWHRTRLTDGWYNKKPRWLAQYSSEPTYNGDYMFWQHTSSGSVDGINGRVDMNIAFAEIPRPAKPEQAEEKISVIYQVWDDVKNKWLPEVTDLSDYAGLYGHDVCAVFARLTFGNIFYKVHLKGGSWLPEVKNREDYAGLFNKPIDGIMMRTDTGKNLNYAVHLRRKARWLPFVNGFDDKNSKNGYAGILGEEIDGIKIYIN